MYKRQVKAVSKLEILVDGKAAGVITDYTADGKNYTANIPVSYTHLSSYYLL